MSGNGGHPNDENDYELGAREAREGIAAYFEHLSLMRIGAIDLTGMPARELYAMVAAWVRNKVDE